MLSTMIEPTTSIRRAIDGGNPIKAAPHAASGVASPFARCGSSMEDRTRHVSSSWSGKIRCCVCCTPERRVHARNRRGIGTGDPD
jgi:hypothetical protein